MVMRVFFSRIQTKMVSGIRRNQFAYLFLLAYTADCRMRIKSTRMIVSCRNLLFEHKIINHTSNNYISSRDIDNIYIVINNNNNNKITCVPINHSFKIKRNQALEMYFYHQIIFGFHWLIPIHNYEKITVCLKLYHPLRQLNIVHNFQIKNYSKYVDKNDNNAYSRTVEEELFVWRICACHSICVHRQAYTWKTNTSSCNSQQTNGVRLC